LPKQKTAKLSVFKGREAKLNKAIFQILALEGPLVAYDIYKQIRAQGGLRHTKYPIVLRRTKALEESGYLQKAGTRKTLPGSERVLYGLSFKTYMALLLDNTDLESLVQAADEDTIIMLLSALSCYYPH
jgi:hypothetical protein